jgi:hypothetical protein
MRNSPDFYNPEGPDHPPPPEPEKDPTHDVPAFPAQDSPPGTETAIGFESPGWTNGPGEPETPDEGEDDVDEDDLDPQVPHSPPDGKKGRIVFDENGDLERNDARQQQKIQQQLDEALDDSFPASDPVSIVTSHAEEDWGEPRDETPVEKK